MTENQSAFLSIGVRGCIMFLQEMFPGITVSCSSMQRIPSCGHSFTNNCGRSHRSAPTITFHESSAVLPGNYV
ncbi:hypothetical protein Cfor_06372 [Coptotermes formosanus]|uniref:Uncharacterized protein n=1 Tax=Coptotermes formosanus TaxID=36987 RepID=A0A6L2PJZ6_COPFO|nr:hypothetical protein Cfor_06372 [Coptotermes formosanus]